MKRAALVVAIVALASLGFGLAGVLRAATPQTVVATVGPGFTVSLKKPNGVSVTTLLPGTYRFLVRDLGTAHNAHLSGPGVNRKTGVAAKATSTWTVTLRAGQYRVFCDVHRSMQRVFRVALRTSTVPTPTETTPPPYPTDDPGY